MQVVQRTHAQAGELPKSEGGHHDHGLHDEDDCACVVEERQHIAERLHWRRVGVEGESDDVDTNSRRDHVLEPDAVRTSED